MQERRCKKVHKLYYLLLERSLLTFNLMIRWKNSVPPITTCSELSEGWLNLRVIEWRLGTIDDRTDLPIMWCKGGYPKLQSPWEDHTMSSKVDLKPRWKLFTWFVWPLPKDRNWFGRSVLRGKWCYVVAMPTIWMEKIKWLNCWKIRVMFVKHP